MLRERISHTSELVNKTVIITGGGGEIAVEAGLALACMGAKVLIGEVNEPRGKEAEARISAEAPGRACYLPLDLTKPDSISHFCHEVSSRFGAPYAIIHNATITPFDAVRELPLNQWDASYLVHLRGPLQLIRHFLPDMLEQKQGVFVFMSSSGAVAYMGGYEVFKTAQVELANTLFAELENSGLSVFSFGPGLVKTQTAMEGIKKVAPLMGLTTEAFYSLNQDAIVSAEEAGTALAASLLYATRYNGQEIGGIQVLCDAGIYAQDEENTSTSYSKEADELLSHIVQIFDEQYEGWQKRNIFERQWVLRDFKKCMGLSADEVSVMLHRNFEAHRARQTNHMDGLAVLLHKLQSYYQRQLEMMKGYIKDPDKRREYENSIQGWIKVIHDLTALLCCDNPS